MAAAAIAFPIHLPNHWAVVVVDNGRGRTVLVRGTVEYYDGSWDQATAELYCTTVQNWLDTIVTNHQEPNSTLVKALVAYDTSRGARRAAVVAAAPTRTAACDRPHTPVIAISTGKPPNLSTTWKQMYMRRWPQQQDDCNCGVYMLMSTSDIASCNQRSDLATANRYGVDCCTHGCTFLSTMNPSTSTRTSGGPQRSPPSG